MTFFVWIPHVFNVSQTTQKLFESYMGKNRTDKPRDSVWEWSLLSSSRFFPVNIAKYLRTLVLKNICEQLFERFPR